MTFRHAGQVVKGVKNWKYVSQITNVNNKISNQAFDHGINIKW